MLSLADECRVLRSCAGLIGYCKVRERLKFISTMTRCTVPVRERIILAGVGDEVVAGVVGIAGGGQAVEGTFRPGPGQQARHPTIYIARGDARTAGASQREQPMMVSSRVESLAPRWAVGMSTAANMWQCRLSAKCNLRAFQSSS